MARSHPLANARISQDWSTRTENKEGKDMRNRFLEVFVSTILLVSLGMPAQAIADEMTQRIQKDLVTLGYDPGNIKGEMDDETVAAIAQFQSERDMPVTGEVSPLLAGIMSAEVKKQRSGGNAAAASSPATAPAQDPAALQAAQQACLQQKIEESQAANKKKRGFGSLMRAVTRTVGQTGNYDLARTTSDVYNANATANDLASAAKDLGLTEDEVAACQNPM